MEYLVNINNINLTPTHEIYDIFHINKPYNNDCINTSYH